MGEKKSTQSWTISDELGEEIKDEVPETKRDAQKHYVHAPGQGRKPMPARKALEGIFYVLRTGCQWKALPGEYGSGSTVHRTFQNGWQRDLLRRSGPKVWKNMVKWKGSAGRGKDWMAAWQRHLWHWSPLERIHRTEEKMGTKRSGLTDENGLPLSVVLSGANTHDVKLLEETLDHIVIFRPQPEEGRPQNLCLDAGYTGSGEKVQERGYTPHIRSRGEGKRSWSAIRISMHAAGSLRSHTLFSTAFANCSFVLRKKPPIIWPWFNWPAPLLSGVNSSRFIADFGIGS